MATHPLDERAPARARVQVGHLAVDSFSARQVVDHVSAELAAGRGGAICTPNLDIWVRTRTDPAASELVLDSEVVVADGMPLVWAARLQGTPIPERVTGSGLVEMLAEAADRKGWSVYVVGGGSEGTAERAVEALRARYPGLQTVGAMTPPHGFDSDPRQMSELVDEVASSDADLVLVGLGFPKQERLAGALRQRMQGSWFLGCGAGVQMAAGGVSRSPGWLQAVGGEWLFRLVQEPRRLARRYLVDDLPGAVTLLAHAARVRARGR